MNFKVKCVERRSRTEWFTVSKIYEICDDCIVDDEGFMWTNWHRSDQSDEVDRLNKYFNPRGYRFKLVSEDDSDEPTSDEHDTDTEVDPIKEVNFDKANLTTTIVWRDGTTTTAVTHSEEYWNEQWSFVFAYCKRLLGNDDTLVKAVRKWVIER